MRVDLVNFAAPEAGLAFGPVVQWIERKFPKL